jgi:hypothetical protein
MKECLRCGQDAEVSAIGEVLINFVCDTCRRDKNGWEFNRTRIKDMEYEMPEPSNIRMGREGRANANEYQ